VFDFVGGGVAGALEGAPHVPAGDGAVGTPAFAEGEEFFGAGLVFFAVGDGPTFLHAEIVDGKNVRAAERKMRNISTVQAPMPRTETRRLTSSSSESFSDSSSVGTTPSMVFLARSFMARTFAPERPALRRDWGRSFSISWGAGMPPVC